MNATKTKETVPQGFDDQGWPLPEVRSLMIDNFARSWLNHKLAVAILFVVAAGLTMFGAWLVTPTWEGFGQITVHPSGMPSLSIVGSTTQESAALTATQMVKNLQGQSMSYDFLEAVVDKSGLDQHLEAQSKKKKNIRDRIKNGIVYLAKLQFLRSGPVTINYKTKALGELTQGMLRITSTEGSTVLPVYVYGDAPDITMKVGDSVMDLLQERMDTALRAAATRQLETLKTLETAALEQVAADDQALEEVRKRYEFFDPASYAQGVQESMNSILQQKADFQTQSDAIDAQIKVLDEQLAAIPPTRPLEQEGTQERPDQLLSTRLRGEIASLDADIAAKSASKGPSSPELVNLRAQRQSLQQSLDEAEKNEAALKGTRTATNQVPDQRYQGAYMSWLDANVNKATLLARYAGLDAQLDLLKKMQANAVNADLEIKRLERQSDANEAHYKMLTSQRRQMENTLAQPTLFTGVVERSNTQVLNPNNPDYPNNILLMILAVVIGLFAGLVLPIAYDYLNQTLLTSRQASMIPGVRVVAAVPHGRGGKLFASG